MTHEKAPVSASSVRRTTQKVGGQEVEFPPAFEDDAVRAAAHPRYPRARHPLGQEVEE